MGLSSSTLLRVIAALSLTSACAPEAVSAPATDRSPAGPAILTSFDRITLAKGERSSFRASLVGSGAQLSSAGLSFASRATAVADVSASNGRVQVQGLGAGRTWVVVQSAAAIDSVEIVVE